MHLPRRVDFGDLCAARRIRRAVEVGTDCGVFAEAFLRRWIDRAAVDCQPECLVCVDPWAPYPHMPYDRTPDLQMAVILLAPFRDRVRLLRATSFAVANELPASRYRSPGFVYIDGDHRYREVRADVYAWWPIVATGGLLAGHDYMPEADGVRRAVDEFVAAHALELHTTLDADEACSWWVDKP